VLAVRIGKLEDSSLIGVRLGTMLAVVVAAPGYLLRYGTAKNTRMFNGIFSWFTRDNCKPRS
jgi:hypothetical protein